jgi:UDPglucose--hexose-1-phosphate uridylyltransferase
MSDMELDNFARILKDILLRLKTVLNDPPYNFVLHTSPNTDAVPRLIDQWVTLKYDYHWHFEIIPRLTRIAGFEWGSGFYINPSIPEEAARYLRETKY